MVEWDAQGLFTLQLHEFFSYPSVVTSKEYCSKPLTTEIEQYLLYNDEDSSDPGDNQSDDKTHGSYKQ